MVMSINEPPAQYFSALLSISPSSMAAGAGRTLLTCAGNHFTKMNVVRVNNVPQVTTYVSDTVLTASVPKRATPGTSIVTITSPSGMLTSAPQVWTFT